MQNKNCILVWQVICHHINHSSLVIFIKQKPSKKKKTQLNNLVSASYSNQYMHLFLESPFLSSLFTKTFLLMKIYSQHEIHAVYEKIFLQHVILKSSMHPRFLLHPREITWSEQYKNAGPQGRNLVTSKCL
jgi:hypothetical protein